MTLRFTSYARIFLLHSETKWLCLFRVLSRITAWVPTPCKCNKLVRFQLTSHSHDVNCSIIGVKLLSSVTSLQLMSWRFLRSDPSNSRYEATVTGFNTCQQLHKYLANQNYEAYLHAKVTMQDYLAVTLAVVGFVHERLSVQICDGTSATLTEVFRVFLSRFKQIIG
jgi:hypothetical protein